MKHGRGDPWTKKLARELLRRCAGSFVKLARRTRTTKQRVHAIAKRYGLLAFAAELRKKERARQVMLRRRRRIRAKARAILRHEEAKAWAREKRKRAQREELRQAIWRCAGNVAKIGYECGLNHVVSVHRLFREYGLTDEARAARQAERERRRTNG